MPTGFKSVIFTRHFVRLAATTLIRKLVERCRGRHNERLKQVGYRIETRVIRATQEETTFDALVLSIADPRSALTKRTTVK